MVEVTFGPEIYTFGPYDERTYEQIVRCAGDDGYGVLCADNHLGYSQPIGGAVAYENHISPSGVGYDIGCGNKAVATSLFFSDIRDDLPKIMDEIARRISFGMGRPNNESVEDHPASAVIDDIMKTDDRAVARLYQKARAQLGTVGGGNHYVDLFREEGTDRIWVGVHFGSRGFGHTVASGFLARAQGKDFGDRVGEGGMDAPPTLIDTRTPLGYAYIEAMTLAGEYAYAGRDIVVDKVVEILGHPDVIFGVHNHHNYAWRETHFGKDVWVIRKGCTPAFPGQEGFVGGSMGDISVILVGKDSPESQLALYSTVHGAGRQMSRSEAAGKKTKRWSCNTRECDWVQPPHTAKPDECPGCGTKNFTKRWVQVRDGKINYATVMEELTSRGIEIRGGAADEAPGAYKHLPEVLEFHENTIDILHTLHPIGVCMAGPGIAADD